MSIENLLKPHQILSSSEETQKYSTDWTREFKTHAEMVLLPESTEDVVSIVKWAREHKKALVPSGGRTGLSGGAVAQGEVVVAFDSMNKVLEHFPYENTLLCEAGVITEQVQKFAEEKGLYFPVDFAAKGSSQIGGNVATNAGGVKVIRYGSTRQWVKGLKVVTGEGKILNLNKGLIKNATGYDLRHLFIGSEGTLGFITEVYLEMTQAPQDLSVFLFSVDNIENIMKVFHEYQKALSLTAFEVGTQSALNCVLETSSAPFPLKEKSEYFILLEIESKDSEKAYEVFEKVFEKGYVKEGVVSQNQKQFQEFWSFRENISESLSVKTPHKNDISLRLSKIPPFLEEFQKTLTSEYSHFEVVWFGHLGDGNLHINILKPEGWSQEEFQKHHKKLDEVLFSIVQKYEGSISAEHGVGLTKKPFLTYSCSEDEIDFMRKIKSAFDPDGILNPNKIFKL